MTTRRLDQLSAALRSSARSSASSRTRVLAIDGPSGSGKTSLAARLAAVDAAAPVIHMDDIFPGWDGLAEAPGLLVDSVLEPLHDGRPAAYHRWDWERGEWAERHDVPARDVLIVEGVGSGALGCAPFLAMLIWVEAPRRANGARYRTRWRDVPAALGALGGAGDCDVRR